MLLKINMRDGSLKPHVTGVRSPPQSYSIFLPPCQIWYIITRTKSRVRCLTTARLNKETVKACSFMVVVGVLMCKLGRGVKTHCPTCLPACLPARVCCCCFRVRNGRRVAGHTLTVDSTTLKPLRCFKLR